MTIGMVILIVAWLAYSNGANDNFKGVATLYGSGTTSYHRALAWATLATLAGSLFSVVLAGRLLKVFSGAGLLSEHLLGSAPVLMIVGVSAAIAVFLATLLGMPTSTTHALAGALLGVAWASASLESPWPTFVTLFAAPLLFSPLIAIASTGIAYHLAHRLRQAFGISSASCLCLRSGEVLFQPVQPGAAVSMCTTPALPQIQVGSVGECHQWYGGSMMGIRAQSAVDLVHYFSAGAVCFSRALNDTPKIAALLLVVGSLHAQVGVPIVALAMAVGGLLQSRRVAETMSRRMTNLNTGQGLTANLVTAILVLFASRMGLPVSTTHVSCGAIFGIGLVQRRVQWKTIAAVLVTWLTTLPLAALLSTVLFMLLQ